MKQGPQKMLTLAVILAGVALAPGVMAAGDNSATGKVEAAAVQVADIARQADLCVEISLSAVENAMAAQDDAEDELMKALKAGNKARISSAEENLEEATEAAEKARDLAKQIIDYGAECNAAATAAREETARLRPEMTDRELASCLKRAEHLIEIARRALKKAEALADILKKRWLLPVIVPPSTATSTTTTTTQPPNPTPVGRR